MSKTKLNQILFIIVVFGLITVLNSWFDFVYVWVWVGAFVGIIFPNLDFLLYAYILRPDGETSHQIKDLFKQKKFTEFGNLAADLSRFEKLIIHTAYFQIIFLALTFFVVSSSSSLFGKGLVLAASLKMYLDQYWEYRKSKNLQFWFSEMQMTPSSDQTRVYLVAVGFILLVFTLMM